jgi:serine/threonine protein kinase
MAVNSSSFDAFQEVVNFLKEKGYTIRRPLGEGEGHTADVFEVEYRNGSLCQTRVVKIPKPEIDPESITTLINRSKGDLDERAVLAQSKISHPNIIHVYDAFKMGDRTITVEESFDAISLDALVRMSGPVTDPERFRDIFSQVFSGLGHLHGDEKLLHRDVKPSNILINRHRNHVKICDLQNVGQLSDLPAEQLLPTRGGTAYTDPSILNALMEGKPTHYTLANEVYALGATMYYVLTGKKLYDVSLKPGTSGRKIQVGNSELEVVLEKDGQAMNQIPFDEHKQELRKKINELPYRYRKLLSYCLFEAGSEGTFNIHGRLDSLLEEACSTHIRYSLRRIARYTGIFVGTAAVIAGLIGGSVLADLSREREMKFNPTLLEMLSSSMFGDGKLEVLLQDPSHSTLDYLAPVFRDLVEHRSEIEGLLKEYDLATDRSLAFNGLGQRLFLPVVLSSLLLPNEQARQEYNIPKARGRDIDTLVPADFVIALNTSRGGGSFGINPYMLRDMEKVTYAGHYLKFCVGTNNSIADVFAGYFTDNPEEVFKARMAADTYNYFPAHKQRPGIVVDEQGRLVDGQEETLKPGYGSQLSPTRKLLIDRALALYYITDHEGNIHWEILDDKYKPTRGLDAK